MLGIIWNKLRIKTEFKMNLGSYIYSIYNKLDLSDARQNRNTTLTSFM